MLRTGIMCALGCSLWVAAAGEVPAPVRGAEAVARVTVNDGPPARVVLPDRLVLSGRTASTAADAGYRWMQVSGPGEAYFSDGDRFHTEVDFTRPGRYRLRLTPLSGDRPATGHVDVEVSRTSAFVARLEGEFQVHRHHRNTFASALAGHRGAMFVTFVDPELRTVVARKSATSSWTTSVVEAKTADNEWHALPSIAVDGEGYVHVVYNMHNSPWQYVRSRRPGDISAWDFLGQANREAERYNEGTAAIPGNDISYPVLVTGPTGDVWATFRECADCTNEAFDYRDYSGGIARYSTATRRWSRVGGTRLPFALGDSPGPGRKRAQGLRVRFDTRGRAHVAWVWGGQYNTGNGGGSSNFTDCPNYPSYAYSVDDGRTFRDGSGRELPLPMRFPDSPFDLNTGVLSPALADPGLRCLDPAYDGDYWYHATDVAVRPTDGKVFLNFQRGHGINDMVSLMPGQPGLGPPRVVQYGGDVLKWVDEVLLTFIPSPRQGTVRLRASADGGATWGPWLFEFNAAGEHPGPQVFLDEGYFLKTGQFRLAVLNTGAEDARLRIYTVHVPQLKRGGLQGIHRVR